MMLEDGNFTMKGKIISYWITTIAVCGFMAFSAFSYLTRDPKLMAAFDSLGYPRYFPTILGVAKALGVIALLVPGFPRLKEWAYAGFTFTFIGAVWSHLASQQTSAVAMPLISLALLAVSYACRPASRRLGVHPVAVIRPSVYGHPISVK
jgi:uncharacterized membrane protein YphA (DoxX/SURF4 family)